MNFDSTILHILSIESGHSVDWIKDNMTSTNGGCTDAEDDNGGLTNWGVTQATSTQYGYGDVRKLTASSAFSLYERQFVYGPGINRVAKLHPELAETMMIFGVHGHPKTAVRALQNMLNLFNNRQKLWKDIKDDGLFGDKTFKALKAYTLNRNDQQGEDVLFFTYAGYVMQHYRTIAEISESQEKWVYGWMVRITDQIKNYAKAL